MDKNVKIEVVETFKFAHRGVEVVEHTKGSVVEVEQECADIAVREKWAKLAGKNKGAVPENKAAAAKAAAIADLEARLAAAPDADKPALQAELDKLTAE